METRKAAPARGMRDLPPPLMRRRQLVIDRLRTVFEAFAFEPFETPAVEQAATLTGKYGPDAERLIYRAGLGEERDLALRYDFSVSLARFCASEDGLSRPFRRYQIGPIWRGERPQRGRFREFYQADVDIVGSASRVADAEILAVVPAAMAALGVDAYQVVLNHRQVLFGIGRRAGVPDTLLPGLYRAIDKRDSVGLAGVRLELRSVGLPGDLLHRQRQAVGRWLRGQADRTRLASELTPVAREQMAPAVADRTLPVFFEALSGYPNGGAAEATVEATTRAVLDATVEALRATWPADELIPDPVTERLLELVAVHGEGRAVLGQLATLLDDPGAGEGLSDLGEMLDLLDAAGAPMDRLVVDAAMVRGLEYYTGMIVETVLPDVPIGSVQSGGRYDRLVSLFGRDLPAVGISFGVDRLAVGMAELGLFGPQLDAPTAAVLVARFDASTTGDAVRVASRLRQAGIPTEAYLDLDRIGDQIRYALRRQIPVVVIIGPDEAAAGQATVRDLVRRREVRVRQDQLVDVLRAAPDTADAPTAAEGSAATS